MEKSKEYYTKIAIDNIRSIIVNMPNVPEHILEEFIESIVALIYIKEEKEKKEQHDRKNK